MSYPVRESTIGEVQTLRQELAATRKRLQDYADTIVSLHGELRTLRDAICTSCRSKYVLANVSSQPAALASSLVESSQSPASSGSHASDHIPSGSSPPTSEIPRSSNNISSPSPVITAVHGNQKPPAISNSLANTSSSKNTPPKLTPRVFRWSVKRDASADPVLHVTFVCAFNHEDSVRSLRFSADGKYLAAPLMKDRIRQQDGAIIIYDVETREKTGVLVDNASQYSSKARPGICSVCFSPDDKYLAIGNMTGHVTVWDIPNKRVRNVFKGHNTPVGSVDFSPNGRLVVSAAFDSTLCVWNMRDGSAITFSDNAQCLCSVKFSPIGRYVAVSENFEGMLRIWDVRTGRLVKRWAGGVRSIAFTPDGRGLVSGSPHGSVKFWDVNPEVNHSGGGSVPEIQEYNGHKSTVYSVAVSPNGRWVVSTSYDKTAILWDTRTARRQFTLIGHKDGVTSADFSPAGTYFAIGSRDGYLTLWRYTEN